MYNYLAFLHSGIEASSGRALEDGKHLADRCIEQLKKLDDPKQFPPRLLILLTSPPYLEQPKTAQLLAGIHQAFTREGYPDIPLIGSSVAAVFFDGQVYPNGALLALLASRLIDVKVAAGAHADEEPQAAIKNLLDKLEMSPGDPNPYSNRMLLTFFPGFIEGRSIAPKLHRLLREELKAQVPIVGGASSANDPERIKPGLQFTDRYSYQNAVVAARIDSGLPLGISIGHGLSRTGRILRITDLSDDKKTIYRFDEGDAIDIFKELEKKNKIVLFSELTIGGDPVVVMPRVVSDEQSVVALWELSKDTRVEVLRAEPERMIETATQLVTQSLKRSGIENPIACFGFKCTSHFRFQDKLGLDIAGGIADIQEKLGGNAPYVGGFVDGEAGMDETGRMLFVNWSSVGLAFGDEMRERTALHRGFTTMAKYAPQLATATSLQKAIELSLLLIVKAGFPGAMISLLLKDQEQDCIVAQAAKGSRFEKIVGMTRRPLLGRDVLAIVAGMEEPHFVRDSRTDPDCDPEAVKESGIISQYIVPLKGQAGNVFAILQVDLGDASYKTELHPAEREVLDSLGSVVGAGLNHISSWEEVRILRELDYALNESLSFITVEEGLQHYIEAVAKAFGLDMGHVRLAEKENHTLVLVAGIGPCYEAAKDIRRKADFGDRSPISQSYLAGGVTVINDAQKNPAFKSLSQRFPDKDDYLNALNQMASLATVAFENEMGERLGILNIASRQSWFFTSFHERALKAVGQRVGFLVEHLKRKRAEKEASERLRFLLRVSPQLLDFDDVPKALTRATARFREAAKAEVAALYLWDQETSELILRAQDGWFDQEWVGAARYGKRDGWTGTIALDDQPRYVPDMRAYKRNTYQQLPRRYAREMFGTEIPDDLTVEAIGLPLKIGDQRLGVLTLHRRISQTRAGKTSGFATTDMTLLQQGADALAVLTSALLSYQDALWASEGRERLEEVLNVLVRQDSSEFSEERVCQQLVASLNAIRTDFFAARVSEKGMGLSWLVGFPHRPGEENEGEVSSGDLPWKAVTSGRVELERRGLSEGGRRDPRTAAMEGLVVRACVPMSVAGSLLGIIDLRWDPALGASPFITRHGAKHLQVLGDRIATAYRRYVQTDESEKAKAQAEQSRREVKALDGLFSQCCHKVEALLRILAGMPSLIMAEETNDGLKERVNTLKAIINHHTGWINRIWDAAKKMTHSPQNESLWSLLREASQESKISRLNGAVEEMVYVSDEIQVWVIKESIRETFVNIIDNSIDAMPDGGILNISASPVDGGDVKIVFEDTGVGMAKEKVTAAMLGRTSRPGHMGIGVLLSKTSVYWHGGTYEMESEEGCGTKVIITLPMTRMEENL